MNHNSLHFHSVLFSVFIFDQFGIYNFFLKFIKKNPSFLYIFQQFPVFSEFFSKFIAFFSILSKLRTKISDKKDVCQMISTIPCIHLFFSFSYLMKERKSLLKVTVFEFIFFVVSILILKV